MFKNTTKEKINLQVLMTETYKVVSSIPPSSSKKYIVVCLKNDEDMNTLNMHSLKKLIKLYRYFC